MLRAGGLDRWLTSRWAVPLLAIIAVIPLIWPTIPPFTDLPGHIGRYRVELSLDSDPALQQLYGFHWAVMGNLGLDILIIPMSAIFGLELGTKLLVMSIPVLTVTGFLLVAREAHGRIPPTALFALPLAYAHPLIFGFVNYALSMALALIMLAGWMALGRQQKYLLRALIAVPCSFMLWTVHSFGWGVLGLLAFVTELERFRSSGKNWIQAATNAAVQCIPLAGPTILMLIWRSTEAGIETAIAAAHWFNFRIKVMWLMASLRDRWELFDTYSVFVLLALLIWTGISPKFHFSRPLVYCSGVLLTAYLLLPHVLFGSAYADMRLVPYLIAISVIAIGPVQGGAVLNKVLFGLGLAFLIVRIGGNSVSFWLYDRAYTEELRALDAIPEHARLFSVVDRPCIWRWQKTRLDHLPSMALARKRAYANDQFAMAGSQLLTVHLDAPGYETDPSQFVSEAVCPGSDSRPINATLRNLPRDKFDYLWMLSPPPYDHALTADFTPVWSNGHSVVYRINK